MLYNKMDNLKFSPSSSSLLSNDDSQPANIPTNGNNHSICKSCFNKLTHFQISFTESICLCINSQCSTSDKNLNEIIKLESNVYKLDKNDQIIKYGYRVADYNKTELDSLFKNDADLRDSIQFLPDLNNVFSNLINKQSNEQTVMNLTNVETSIQTQFFPIDQDSLFSFPGDSYDSSIENIQQSNTTPMFTTDYTPSKTVDSTPIELNQQLNQQARSESTTSQFDENFFTSIDDLLQNDLNVLDQDFVIGQPIYDFNKIQPCNISDNSFQSTTTTTTYAELNSTSQQELSSKLANNFLYSNDFLNPTQIVSSDQLDSLLQPQPIEQLQITTQEIITDVKLKTGSSIKITRLNKKPQKNFCLSPTSLPSSAASNSQTSTQDSSNLELSVQLSSSSQDTDLFKTLESTKTTKKSKNENNFLPWEVSLSKPVKRQPIKRDSLVTKQDDFNNKSIRPMSRITKADLAVKTSQQKSDFGKEKGAQLKRALLEDTNFLTQTRLVNSSSSASSVGSAKDLVLSVLKKRAVV